MPFYEYECSACKFYVEVLQKISEPPLRDCPSCGKPALTKLVSAPVFRLKGSGWYETDFKSDGENKRNLVEDSAKASASESSSDSADTAKSKPAKSSTPKATKPAKAAAKPAAKPAAKAPAKPAPAKKAPAKKAAAKQAKPKS